MASFRAKASFKSCCLVHPDRSWPPASHCRHSGLLSISLQFGTARSSVPLLQVTAADERVGQGVDQGVEKLSQSPSAGGTKTTQPETLSNFLRTNIKHAICARNAAFENGISSSAAIVWS